MDESKPPIPLSEIGPEIGPPPASGCESAAVDAGPADPVKSANPVAPVRQTHSDPSELCRNDPAEAPSVVVYCGNEEEVGRGFLMALRAMGLAAVEQPPAPEAGLPTNPDSLICFESLEIRSLN